MAWWRDFGYYPPSRPRAARGGIKAQTKGGTFGKSWWARRWIEVLESFNIGARLGRGRAYARRGQVLSIAIGKGTVSARVQGSRPEPYQVRIKVATLSRANWKRLAEALGRQALFAAKLLAGGMPEDIEKAFQAAGLSLFPVKSGDLQTDCSCPDWSNPCKHIAAVYYLLGEEFDRDPFLIFTLRGMGREELIGLIGGAAAPKGKGTPRQGTHAETESVGESPAVPLPREPGAFWGQEGTGGDSLGEVRIPPVAAALLRRLGNFPFWRGEEAFADVLEGIYREAAVVGMDVFLGGQAVWKER
ncbi:MAG: SWIM zinc finger family protein [candidate division NC10 bacterium]